MTVHGWHDNWEGVPAPSPRPVAPAMDPQWILGATVANHVSAGWRAECG